MNHMWIAAWVALGCAAGAGCAGAVPRPYAEPTAAQLLAHLGRRDGAIRSLRTQRPPKIDHWSKEGRIKTPVLMLIERPDKLRFDAESPMAGKLLATLTTDGKAFQLLDYEKHVLYEGPPDPCNVARLIEISMPPADVATILLGGSPLPAGLTPTVTWDAKNRREVLTFALPDGTAEVVALDGSGSPPTWEVRRAELRDRAGAVLWRLEHEDFADVGGGVRLPKVSRFEKPAEKADVIVRWKDGREVNAALPADSFTITAPPGIPRQRMRCP
jgi:hypothetical protein